MALGLYITDSCTLSCRYCFNWEKDGDRNAGTLDMQEIAHVLQAGRSAGHRYLTITGGEPFLHPDISGIIQHANDLGYFINILTNGLLIDSGMVGILKGKCRLRIRVSLEGANRETHEYFRGPKTFDRALESIRRLSGNGIIVGVGFTVYQRNINEIDDMVQLCLSMGCEYVRFSPVMRISRGRLSPMDFNLHEQTLTRIVEAHIKHKDSIELGASKQRAGSLPIETLTTKRCEGGVNFFAISPQRMMFPCPLIRSDSMILRTEFKGKEDFAALQRGMDNLFKEIGEKLKGECGECKFRDTCLGGCPAEKLSFERSLYDDQPVCFKRIMEKVESKFDKQAMELIRQSWTFALNSTYEENKDSSKYCFRQSPVWTIRFKGKYA